MEGLIGSWQTLAWQLCSQKMPKEASTLHRWQGLPPTWLLKCGKTTQATASVPISGLLAVSSSSGATMDGTSLTRGGGSALERSLQKHGGPISSHHGFLLFEQAGWDGCQASQSKSQVEALD